MRKQLTASARRQTLKERAKSTTRSFSINCFADCLPLSYYLCNKADKFIIMKRIQFKIDFIRIIYKLHSKKDFTIRLTLEDKEGTKIKAQEASIPKEQDSVDLQEMSFELYLASRQRRGNYLPFNLYFTVNTVPSIKRKMQLNLDRISEHYFDNRYQSTALEQIYSFQEGEIIYIVNILNGSTITNQAEAATYDKEINREASAKKIEEEFQSAMHKKSLARSRTQNQTEDGSKLTENTKLEIPQTTSEYEDTSERGRDGEYWGDLDEEEDDRMVIIGSEIGVKEESSNITLKLILILLVIGFIALLYDVYKDPQMSNKQRKRTKKKAEEKEFKKGRKTNKLKH